MPYSVEFYKYINYEQVEEYKRKIQKDMDILSVEIDNSASEDIEESVNKDKLHSI